MPAYFEKWNFQGAFKEGVWKRITGFEPVQPAWKAGMLSADIICAWVERVGNDPTSFGFSDRRSDLLSYRSIPSLWNFSVWLISCVPVYYIFNPIKGNSRSGTWTHSHLVNSQPLYHWAIRKRKKPPGFTQTANHKNIEEFILLF